MYIAFLDDTKAYGWVAEGGLIVPAASVRDLELAFADILRSRGVPIGDPDQDTEVKWSAPAGNWIRDNLGGDVIEDLRAELLGLLGVFGASLIAAAINCEVERQNGQKFSEPEAQDLAFACLFEILQEFGTHKDSSVLVICDTESSPPETRARIKQTLSLVMAGSEYLPLMDRIYRHAWVVESQHHAGIQLADLIVGITCAMVREFKKYAERHWRDNLQGKFLYQDHLQTPQRFGLRVLPAQFVKGLEDRLDPYGCRSGFRKRTPYGEGD